MMINSKKCLSKTHTFSFYAKMVDAHKENCMMIVCNYKTAKISYNNVLRYNIHSHMFLLLHMVGT